MRLWNDGHFQGQNISPKKRAGPGGFGLNLPLNVAEVKLK